MLWKVSNCALALLNMRTWEIWIQHHFDGSYLDIITVLVYIMGDTAMFLMIWRRSGRPKRRYKERRATEIKGVVVSLWTRVKV
jgi:hypothetical protein